MAYVNMEIAIVQDGGERSLAFEYSKSLAAAGSTDSILISDDIQTISVSAEGAGGATATIYSTTDPIAVVKSGTGITWISWAAGAVTTAVASAFNPVTAIKMTQTNAGTSKITVRAQ